MPARAVVFDFGGVLSRIDRDFISQVARDFGLTGEEIRAAFGGPGGENALAGTRFGVDDVAEQLALALPERLGERAREAAAQLCTVYVDPDRMSPIPGMLALLAELQAAQVPVGILSNGPREVVKKMLGLLGEAMPSAVWLSGERGVGKPAPAAYRAIASMLGVTPENCVFIDDTPMHVEGAGVVGMQALLFAGNPDAIRMGLREAGLSW